MNRYLQDIIDSLFGDEDTETPRYHAKRVAEEPNALEPSTVYLVGSERALWHAVMVCPCGCGEPLFMNLQGDTRPCWRSRVHWDDTVSLYPSVRRKVGCKCHFFLTKGKVRFATWDY